jgi:hypothetical protein
MRRSAFLFVAFPDLRRSVFAPVLEARGESRLYAIHLAPPGAVGVARHGVVTPVTQTVRASIVFEEIAK